MMKKKGIKRKEEEVLWSCIKPNIIFIYNILKVIITVLCILFNK